MLGLAKVKEMVRRVNYKDGLLPQICLSGIWVTNPAAATVAICASAVGRTE